MPVLLLAVACASLALVLVPATTRLGPLDLPGSRSSHRSPVPRTGGIGVAAAMSVGLLAFGLADALSGGPWAAYLVPAALALCAGLADDFRRLSARVKFALQAAVAALAVLLGLRWGGAAHGPFPALSFGAADPVMTWLWLFAVGTVVNFLDGIDGITCATAPVLLAAGAAAGAGPGDGALYGAAAGATVGLAFWNATPARMFPGDGTTHLLGFLVGSVACGVPEGAHPAVALPWVVASAPLLPAAIDIGWGIVAKRRRGLSFGEAHDDHLYQRLTRAGWSHLAVAARYGALSLAGLALALLSGPLGLAPTLALSAALLSLHLADGLRVSRRFARRDPVVRHRLLG